MTEMPARSQRASVDGAAVSATVTSDGLDLDGRLYSWLDVDDVDEGDHRVRLGLADGSSLALMGLGATHADFIADLRRARRELRFAALTIATGDPIASFVSRAGDGFVDVHLFPKALVLEPRRGHPTSVPLPLIDRVARDGYRISISCRGMDGVQVQALGAKTDEFESRLATARRELQAAACAAFVAHEARLEGFVVPDGWAVERAAAGAYWGVLTEAGRSGERGEYFSALEGLAGERLRMGLYTDGGALALPFVLAPVGDRVAVESVDDEARATFVFRAPDVDRLNAVLLLTSFRREALFLPDDALGRWSVAVRVFPAVREARASLVARVVHDAQWSANVRAALGA